VYRHQLKSSSLPSVSTPLVIERGPLLRDKSVVKHKVLRHWEGLWAVVIEVYQITPPPLSRPLLSVYKQRESQKGSLIQSSFTANSIKCQKCTALHFLPRAWCGDRDRQRRPSYPPAKEKTHNHPSSTCRVDDNARLGPPSHPHKHTVVLLVPNQNPACREPPRALQLLFHHLYHAMTQGMGPTVSVRGRGGGNAMAWIVTCE